MTYMIQIVFQIKNDFNYFKITSKGLRMVKIVQNVGVTVAYTSCESQVL